MAWTRRKEGSGAPEKRPTGSQGLLEEWYGLRAVLGPQALSSTARPRLHHGRIQHRCFANPRRAGAGMGTRWPAPQLPDGVGGISQGARGWLPVGQVTRAVGTGTRLRLPQGAADGDADDLPFYSSRKSWQRSLQASIAGASQVLAMQMFSVYS